MSVRRPLGGKFLVLYCEDNDMRMLRAALTEGASPNWSDTAGRTALMSVRSAEAVKLLIKHGADVNQKDAQGTCALFYADQLEVFDALINAGSLLHDDYRCNIFHKARTIEIGKRILQTGLDINERDNKGETALFRADLSTTKTLIALGADVNIKSNSGATALMESGMYETTKALIEAGADVNAVSNTGFTPLAYSSDYKILRLMLDAGADVNVYTTDEPLFMNMCYLHKTNSIEREKMLKAVIPLVADVNVRRKSDGKTALMLCKNIPLAKLLMSHGADIMMKDNDGLRAHEQRIPSFLDYVKDFLTLSYFEEIATRESAALKACIADMQEAANTEVFELAINKRRRL